MASEEIPATAAINNGAADILKLLPDKSSSGEGPINDQEVLTTVLDYVVGGKFDIEDCCIFIDSQKVLVLLELLDSSPLKVEIIELLHMLIKKSIKNRQRCTDIGLIARLLRRIPTYKDDKLSDRCIDVVGVLATYSITVQELKLFFAFLRRAPEQTWGPHALKLLEILKIMLEKHGPDSYFHFTGKPEGAINVPTLSKWPHQPGFTFTTWLQLDAAHLSPSEQANRPHVYSFVNNRGLGYSCHFSGPMLVVEVLGKNSKTQTILVKFRFEPQMWYHVCVAFTYNRFKSSEVRIYVNGQMVTSGDVTMPSNKDPMDKCFIGGSYLNEDRHIFKGQMSSVYLFVEPLQQNTIIALYRLGPGYKGTFKFTNELESPIADSDRKLIYDSKLSQLLLFTYNPKAVDGELCLESSPNDSQVFFYHSPHAMMRQGVQAIVTHSLQAAMHSLGGIQMLFPLFTQLDCPLFGQSVPDPRICPLLLGIIYDLLRGANVFQQQLLHSHGFMVIGHLLEKSSAVHLTEATVDILLGLARYFMATPSANSLLGGLLDHILLNPTLWIKTPLALQANLLSLFATGYVGGLDYAGYIRKEVGVPRLMLMLRKYYCVKKKTAGVVTVEEVISLRAFVLLLIKQMIIKDNGIQEDELKSILVYLAIEEEEDNFTDVLQLLLSVMCELPQKIIPTFDTMEGFHVFFKLLVAEDEQIRVYSLKLLCAYVQQLPLQRKLELVEKYSFISKIGQKLLVFPITMVTYNALFELLTARASKIISTKRHATPDSTCIIYHPTVLPIIVNLLLKNREDCAQAPALQESMVELTKIFLSDLVFLLNNSNDNRRLLLQLMCWQDWLFALSYFEPKNKDEVKISDTVFSVIKMLLHYAMQHEKEGWRVWVDTLSILHGKVTEACAQLQATSELRNSDEVLRTPQVTPGDEKRESANPETFEVDTPDASLASKISLTEPTSSNIATPKSPGEKGSLDIRKRFFENILLQSKAALVDKELLRRTQSDGNLATEAVAESDSDRPFDADRPRSASPTVASLGRVPFATRECEANGSELLSNRANSDEADEIRSASVRDKGSSNLGLSQSFMESPEESGVASISLPEMPNALPVVSENASSVSCTKPLNPDLLDGKQLLCTSVDGENHVAHDIQAEKIDPTLYPRVKCKPFVDIPEFSWSPMHQRLLTELLFSIEADMQVWKTHTRKTIADFISARENATYIMNLCHMVSILADSLVYCCGGLLPLLSSATSQNFANDVFEACGGMSLDASFAFLNRVMNIVDVVAFASSMNFAAVEAHRNMSAGGVLRQCIRLVFCGATRNRVVCRQRERPDGTHLSSHIHPKTLKETQAAIQSLIASTKPATNEDPVQNIPGHMTTITNPDKLLQDSDINRLRALVYRDVEDSRQSQYVALVVIYFVAVLMVARYRDILEHDAKRNSDRRRHSSQSKADEELSPRTRSQTWTSGQRGSIGDDESTELRAPFTELSLDDKIEVAFQTPSNLLKEILFDFSHYLSRVLVGSRGQDLISEGLGSLKSEDSTVELVMLLCSQEWQNCLQKQAGSAFIDLVNEGRLLSHLTRERIVITASEARNIMGERQDYENLKHAQFETVCTRTVISCIEQYRTYDQFFKAKRKRNASSAAQSLEKILDILTSEFGAWPSAVASNHVHHLKLDRWEDRSRRKMRMIRNAIGTSHPQATLRPGLPDDVSPAKLPPMKYHLFVKKPRPESAGSADVEAETELDVNSLEDSQWQNQQANILMTTSCRVVSPGAVIPGSLAITGDSLYFTADEDSKEIRKIDPQVLLYNDCLNVKCSFLNITAVFARRYLLQNKAVELFMANRRSFFFAFDHKETVKEVIHHLPPVGIGNMYGLPRTRVVSLASPKKLFAKSNMRQRWQNKEISNFEYLMFLNTIAGRTYNDLNQYFVFPWILQDYESTILDLNDRKNFRDLSKPIGAINPFRLGQFIERFNSWDSSDGIPAFHYGTHYSTAGFVLNFLVRVEPFASMFLSLQGGKFDHPLRTFSSMSRAWANCQRDTSDVKELIPELFYLTDMFCNKNKFVFGDSDNGEQIDNVKLPPWAQTPEEFVIMHREALESDAVSESLHKWIDLIFGYKQTGVDAEHAANVFYHLTYEGSVDMDSITDPVTKEAVEQQIRSFGQTPCQLLNAPHPPRFIVDKSKDTQEEHKSVYLSFSVTPEVPVTYVAAYTNARSFMPAIITISCNQVFSVNRWINAGGSITNYQSLKNVQIEQDPALDSVQGRLRRQLGEPLDERMTVTSSCFTSTSDNRFILACGYSDNSFKCFSTESGKLTQCIFGHWDVVTCLAYSDDDVTGANAIIVSGSRDATVLVWIWDCKLHRVNGASRPAGPDSTPVAICTGHDFPVTCVDVSTSVGIVASGCVEGPCLLHSLSGDLLCSLKPPGTCVHPRLINISNEGNILVSYADAQGWMALFSINGCFLREAKLEDQNLAVCFTGDGSFFVTGGFARCFQIWRTFDMLLVSSFPPCDGSIRCLALTPDQKCMVAGLSTGAIIALAMDFAMWPRLTVISAPSNDGSINHTTSRDVLRDEIGLRETSRETLLEKAGSFSHASFASEDDLEGAKSGETPSVVLSGHLEDEPLDSQAGVVEPTGLPEDPLRARSAESGLLESDLASTCRQQEELLDPESLSYSPTVQSSSEIESHDGQTTGAVASIGVYDCASNEAPSNQDDVLDNAERL